MADTPIVVGGKYRYGPAPSSDWVEVTYISPNGKILFYKGLDQHDISEYMLTTKNFKSIIDAWREGEQ